MFRCRRAISIGLCTCSALLLIGLIVACNTMTPTPANLNQGKAPDTPVLKIYARPDQFAPEVLAAFGPKHGAKVEVSLYQSEPELLNTLLNSPIDFDLVLASSYMIPQLRSNDLLRPLDKGQLSNLSQLAPEFQNPQSDPGNRYCVAYQWGTIGVGYDSKTVSQKLVSWQDVFSPTQPYRLALPGSPRVTLGVALLATGSSPNTTEKAKLDRAEQLLANDAGHIITYTVSPVRQLLDGSVDIAVDRAGNLIAASRQNPVLKIALPREGSLQWTDYLCLMKDAPNAALAEAFLNELLEPQAGLATVQFTGQSSPNQAVVRQLPPAEQTDPMKYPAADSPQRERLFKLVDLGSVAADLYSHTWSKLVPAR